LIDVENYLKLLFEIDFYNKYFLRSKVKMRFYK